MNKYFIFNLETNVIAAAVERKLKRSLSDRQNSGITDEVTVFNDTMRIHVRHKSRPDSRAAFERPVEPPPPPPPTTTPTTTKTTSSADITELFLCGDRTAAASDGESDQNRTVVQVSPSDDRGLECPAEPEQKTSILINSSPGLKTSVIIGEGGAAYAASSDNKVTISIGPTGGGSGVGRGRGVGTGIYRSNVTVVDRSGNGMAEFIRMNYDPVQAARLNVTPHVCGRPSGGGCDTTPLVSPYRVSEIEKHHLHHHTHHHVGGESPQPMSASDTESSSAESCYASAKEDASYSSASSSSSFSSLSSSGSATAAALTNGGSGQPLYDTTEPIYEEIPESLTPPPLPSCPPPERIDHEYQQCTTIPSRSIFEGATKYDIINYLVDAKRRCGALQDTVAVCHPKFVIVADEQTASESDTNGTAADSGGEEYGVGGGTAAVQQAVDLDHLVAAKKTTVDIERNDSGVGSETSQSSRSKWQQQHETQHSCEDCDQPVEIQTTDR